MKTFTKHLIRGFSLLLVMMINFQAHAQDKIGAATNTTGEFALSVQNLKQTSSTKLEFDAYLLDTEPSPVLELGSIQLGFLLNSNISSGTLSVRIDNSGSGLIAAQQFADIATVSTLAGNKFLIKLPGQAAAPKGSATIISTVGKGTLLTHFIVTSSIPFNANSTPNLSFTSSSVVDPSYPTQVAEYRLTYLTQLDVNIGAVNATVTGNPALNVLPIIYTISGNGSYCQNTNGISINLTSSELGVTYTLYKNGNAQSHTLAGTGTAITFGNQLAGTYVIKGENFGGTSVMNGTAVITENPTVPVSVSISPSANNVCAGTSVSFTATPQGGGSDPTYQWYKNGSVVGSGATYTDVNAANGDVVYVKLTSNAPCATGSPASSNNVTLIVIPIVPVSVSIVASSNNVCAGTSVTYTATPVGGGTTPTYQWFKNSVSVGTGATYTDIPTNGEAVKVVLTSSLPCTSDSPATSNIIQMVVNPLIPASVTIAVSANNVCEGSTVTFTATPVGGGTAPTYQWYEDGKAVATGSVYTDADASNGEVVNVVMTSNAICATGSPATSNSITMTTIPLVPASVSIVVSANNVCEGSSVTFTATPVGGGTAPTYQWYENGEKVATGATYTDQDASNGEVVKVVMTSNAVCASGSPATSNSITMTTIPLVPASVTIAVSANNVCEGSSATFTATPVGGGTTPTYEWFENNQKVATGATYTDEDVSNGEIVKVVMTSNAPCATGSPATSNSITMTTIPLVPASVSIAVSANNVCEGSSVTFTATPVGGGTTPTYEWFENNQKVATGAIYTDEDASNGEIVKVVMTSNAPCATGSPATSNSITMTTIPLVPASVSIEVSANNVCEGSSVTFTATPVGGGSTPTYQWYENGEKVATGATYTDEDASNGEIVYVVMTSNAICASGSPAKSNSITMTTIELVPASVSIEVSANNVCEGTQVTYTAIPVGGGTAPTYQWFENGEKIATGATFTEDASDGDVVYVVMTSNAVCATGSPATSNSITMTTIALVPASVSVSVSQNNVCQGTPVTFTAAAVGGGTTPAYQWFKNNTAVATGNIYTYDASNGDVVYVEMTSSAICATGSPATSNSITMTTIPLVPASVTIVESANNVCEGTSVTFTATPVGGGTAPTYQWFENGEAVGTGLTFTDNEISNGDAVYVVMTSNAICASGSPATSNTVNMIVNPIVEASVSISASGTNVCEGSIVTFTATPIGGGSAPSYQWFENGELVGTGATYSDEEVSNNDEVYVIMTSNALCVTGSPATSNKIAISTTNVPVGVFIIESANNVCDGSTVTFTATPIGGGTAPTYQWYENGEAVGTGSATFADEDVSNGDVVYVEMTSNALCAAGNPSTSNSIAITANPIINASVSIVASDNDVCKGTSITFTATPIGGGSAPTYQWFKNEVAVGTGVMYTDNGLSNNDIVNVVMTSNASPCLMGSPATSNSITMVINPIIHASVTITSNANNVCEGSQVTFTAIAENGGSAPTYQWFENEKPVGTETSFTDDDISNGDVVYVIMTSNASPCLLGSPATSNSVTIVANPVVDASVTIQESTNDVCAGTLITFTANPVNGGTSPTYQWFKNSVAVGSGDTFTDASANGDQVYVVMTSSLPCTSGSPATSNIETMDINPVVPVSVSITASENPICEGNWIVYTAIPVGGGTAPTYQWFKNGIVDGTDATYVDDSDFGDQVYVVMTSNAVCATGNPATSNTITIISSSVSIVASDNNVCAGTPVTFTVAPVGGGTAPTYQWYKNTQAVGTGDSYTYTPVNGDAVYVVMTSSVLCANGSPVTSNVITMNVNPIIYPTVTLAVNASAVTAGIPVTFEVHPQGGGSNPVYRWFVNTVVNANNGNVFTFTPEDNDEVYVEMTSNASPCLTGSPVVSNTIKMSVSIGTSINQSVDSKFNVYSFNKNIFVDCKEEAKQIFIYNSLGSLIKYDTNVNGLKKFDMNNVVSAYYFVKVITQYNVYSERVLLK